MLSSSLAGRVLGVLPGPWRERAPASYRLLILALGVSIVVASLDAVWAFTIDDAGISYAYAKHIGEGSGPVAAVGGPWVEGYSNPLWVFLLVPFGWFGPSIPLAAKWLAAGLFGLTLGLGVALSALMTGRRFRQWGACEMAFVIASAACLEVVVWAPAGLENALLWALTFGMLLLDARESEAPDRFPWSGFVAFLLSITRPEAVLYAAPLLALKLGRAIFKREPLRQALLAAGLFAAPFVLYQLVHYSVFAELLPNTYYAKPGNRDWAKGLAYLVSSARESGLVYAAPLSLLGLLGPYGRYRHKLMLGWVCLAGVLFVIYSGGDWMPHARFLSLFAPAWLLLAALGLGQLSVLCSRLSRGHAPSEVWALVVCVPLMLSWYGYQEPRLEQLSRTGWCHFCERLRDTERVLQLGERAGLPMQALVTHDFGGPSWLSDEQFYPIDFLGLCDRSVALIRGRRLRGSIGDDYRLYQYLIHEQSSAPSWVLLPPNFWPRFGRSAEYLWDYYALSPRLLPMARRDSYFALHRGELVDYFPPLSRTEYRPMNDRLSLLGWALSSDPSASPESDRLGPGARVRAVLSVVPTARLRGTEQLALRVQAGAERVESKLQRLDRGIEGLAKQIAPGEPLAFEVGLTLPAGPADSYRVSLGLGHAEGGSRRNPKAGHAPVFQEIGTFDAGTPLAPSSRALPRYPNALPPSLDAELFRLEPEVTAALELSRSRGEPPAHRELARELAAAGVRLGAAGQSEQAYLANVWAARVDRRGWETLADTVFELRPAARGQSHATEIALLRRYYAAGAPDELARLIAFYLSEGRSREADYFWRRWPELAPDTAVHAGLREAMRLALAADGAPQPLRAGTLVAAVVADPLGGAFDFEEPGLAGWNGDPGVFRAGPDPDRRDLFAFRGEHGKRVLSSGEVAELVRGQLESPEFPLNGRVLSVLVAGGSEKQRVGVQLVVDGKVVFSASGNDSDNLLPVFWNVAELAGKSARLRVFDQNPRDHVIIDRVLLWR